MLYCLGADSIKEVSVGKRLKRKGTRKRYLELRYFALQYPEWKRKYAELDGCAGLASRGADILRVNASKIADRTAEIAIQRKLLSDYIRMVEQAVTANLTLVALKQVYDMPCERDMFYDRRRKFYWALSRVR